MIEGKADAEVAITSMDHDVPAAGQRWISGQAPVKRSEERSGERGISGLTLQICQGLQGMETS